MNGNGAGVIGILEELAHTYYEVFRESGYCKAEADAYRSQEGGKDEPMS